MDAPTVAGTELQEMSQGESAYARLLDAIRDGEFQPGDRLREIDVAARLSLSRTPVREALRKLESDGIVEHRPRIGAVIRRLSQTEVVELYEMRLVLEELWSQLCEQGASVEVTHYLTNFEESRATFYSIEIDGGINVRIVRGLSVNVSGGVEFIHDQLYLPKSDASDEDILLGRISLPTSYEFNFEVGLNYSFGSIFNSVVNPRFGSWF